MQAGARCIEALRASVTSSTRCLFVLSRATCPTAISPRALCGQFTQRRGFRYARKVRPEAKYRLPQSQSLPPRPPCPTIWSVTEGSPNLIEEQAERTSVEELERELLWNARHHPNLFAVEHLLEYLVVKRNVQPAVPHYEALILANCDPLLGSADYAASVIDDMEQNGIQAPSLADAAMLQVLMIHPDQTLREIIIAKIKKEWITIPESTYMMIIGTLLREGQIDAAKLDMKAAAARYAPIPVWIHVLLVHQLCDTLEYDTLVCAIYDLHDQGVELPRPTLLYLLSAAADYGHLPTVEWIWMKHVQPGFICPGADCCRDIKALAAQDLKKYVMLEERATALLQRWEEHVQGASSESHGVAPEPSDASSSDVSDFTRPAPVTSLGERLAQQTALEAAPWPDEGFFDPKKALSMQLLPRFLNQRRREQRTRHHSWLDQVFGRAQYKPKPWERPRPADMSDRDPYGELDLEPTEDDSTSSDSRS